MSHVDRFGRTWDLSLDEYCTVCGQPDNCGDCNHKRLTMRQVDRLGGGVMSPQLVNDLQHQLDEAIVARTAHYTMRDIMDVMRRENPCPICGGGRGRLHKAGCVVDELLDYRGIANSAQVQLRATEATLDRLTRELRATETALDRAKRDLRDAGRWGR